MADSDSPGPIQELTTSRARFVAELGERLTALRQGLSRMASSAEPGAELNAVRRRLHALAAAADVLRFTTTADALALAETALASPGAPTSPARERVGRILDLLPSLVLGASVDVNDALEAEHVHPLREPLCIVLFADAALEALLHKAGPLHAPDTFSTTDPERAVELVTRHSPDLILLDGDHAQAVELVPRLRQAGGSRVPLVAVGSFERHESMLRLIRRGVSRVLPQPVDTGSLQRTVRQCCVARTPLPVDPSRFRRLSSDELIAAIGIEARRAFADAQSGDKLASSLDFGSGSEVLAALWAAFARIRGLAALGSEGAVRFPASGPGGAIPLAPLSLDPAHSAPAAEHATLAGRTIVVGASDAGVCTLLARTLEQRGAVVIPARGGAHAIELAERHWPDAIVADALMPDVSGFELCQRLRLDMALADTPVALVFWKDDLLDRARHVDATLQAASGALDPSSVTRELEEALAARANLERRLARHERVGGRLEGITPRLILELACSRAPDARLTAQCGAARFEIVLSEGRIARVEGGDPQPTAASDQNVLAAFFGLRRGRFTLEPLDETPPAGLAGDLKTLLAPIVSRARRARAVIESTDLDTVHRVLLAPFATRIYLDDSTGAERSLVTRLQSGSSPSSLTSPRNWDDAAPAPVAATLLELARRGALEGLLDARGHDLLGDGAAHAEVAAHEPRDAHGAALLDLGEAVRQAISRTPAPPPSSSEASNSRASAADQAIEAAQPNPALPARVADTTASAEPPAADDDDDARREPALRSYTSEADPVDAAAELDADDGAPRASSHELDEDWPPSASSRARAVAVPLLITLSAAAAAFVAVRALGEGGWQTLQSALRSGSAEAAVAGDAGAPAPPSQRRVSAAPPAPVPEDVETAIAAERRKVPVDVVFEAELLELPLQARLRPGQGLLEVRTWERQPIYVDGVFMGNYESRLIPLVPGTYQVQLRDGGRHIERSVEVRAGQRTLLSARPKSARP